MKIHGVEFEAKETITIVASPDELAQAFMNMIETKYGIKVDIKVGEYFGDDTEPAAAIDEDSITDSEAELLMQDFDSFYTQPSDAEEFVNDGTSFFDELMIETFPGYDGCHIELDFGTGAMYNPIQFTLERD